jgi:hypothetical protein
VIALHPSAFDDEKTRSALQQALRDIWQVLKARPPYPDWEKDLEFKDDVIDTLIMLAEIGSRVHMN